MSWFILCILQKTLLFVFKFILLDMFNSYTIQGKQIINFWDFFYKIFNHSRNCKLQLPYVPYTKISDFVLIFQGNLTILNMFRNCNSTVTLGFLFIEVWNFVSWYLELKSNFYIYFWNIIDYWFSFRNHDNEDFFKHVYMQLFICKIVLLYAFWLCKIKNKILE